MVSQQAQLHVMTNNPTIYEYIMLKDFRILLQYVKQCIPVKQSKSHNSCKFCLIKMEAQQAQLHVMTNNPTIYEHIILNGFRGAAFTRSYYITLCIKQSMSHTSNKLCLIQMATQQIQLHVMTNNPTIHEHIMLNGFRGAAFTRSYYIRQCIKQ